MLTEIQEQALEAVKADPNGHLRLGLREMIWAEFGPRATSDNYLSVPHRQRIALAVAGVRHVLPLWEERYPDSDIPTVALAAIDAITQGGESGDASDTFDELWEAVMHLAGERPFPEVAVGFAAVQALSIAMYDQFFDADDLDADREDGDDPEGFDSAYWASVAAAHGQPSDPESSSELRLEFWTWWITEAVDRISGFSG
jgi:hypothetical protein